MHKLLPILVLVLWRAALLAQVVGYVPDTSSARAVIIGVSNYQDESINDLTYADVDAQLFADFLQSPAGGSLADQHLRLLTNEQATLARIEAALSWLVKDVQESGLAIIYFAGHGDVENESEQGTAYLLAHDTPKNNYPLNALSLDFLDQKITKLAAKNVRVVVISDACHSGSLAGDANNGRQATARKLMQRQGDELKILSCQPYELSQEGTEWGGGHGVFSYYLIDGLKGLADADDNDVVDLHELELFLQDEVWKATGRTQHPDIFGGYKREAVAIVNKEIVVDFRSREKKSIQGDYVQDYLNKLASEESRKRYLRFDRALKRGRFIKPSGKSAADYYHQILADSTLFPLRGIIDESFTIALVDSVQQAINAYLDADPGELAQRVLFSEKYREFPRYLQQVADILGPEDTRYEPTLAKQYYFEGLVLRLEAEQQFGVDSIYQQALGWQLKALEKEDKAAYIYNELGILKRRLGQTTQAAEFLHKAAKLAPTWAIPYNNLAILHKNNKEPQLAKKFYQKAIALKESFSSAYANLGNIYNNSKPSQVDSAEFMYLKAIEFGNNYPDNHYNLAVLYNKSKDSLRKAQAEWEFRKVLQLDGRYWKAYWGLGNMFLNIGKVDSAIAVYQRGLVVAPQEAVLHRHLGLAYANKDNMASIAEKAYLSSLLLNPSYLSPYLDLGYLYPGEFRWLTVLGSNNLEKAEKYALADKIGLQFYREKKYENALMAFQFAIELDDQNPLAYFHQTVAYTKLENVEKACWKSLKTTLRVAQKADENYFSKMVKTRAFAELRTDKRFPALMQRHYPEQWVEHAKTAE
ncbi:MAG: caspase family protein [Bacteroidota bacterium]